MKKLFLTGLSIAAASFAQVDKEALRTSPIANPPQFVVLGSDDNTKAEALAWMQKVIDEGANKDGSKRYMSFYVNTDQSGAIWDGNNALVDAAYNAYKAGHEIGNHTSTHIYCVEFGEINEETGIDNGKRRSKDEIFTEIKRVQNVLESAGIPKLHQTGFRTPYLRYSDSTFTAIDEVGNFLYDCSISAASDNVAGTNYFPYKIDTDDGSGNFAPDNSADINPWGLTSPIREHANLWELPCVNFAIDPQDIEYVKGVTGYETDENGNLYITGLDYNLWNEAKLDSGQTVRSLMHTLKQSLAGNRAPVTIGIHSQYYFEAKNNEFPEIPSEKRQQAFAEFVKQASQLDNVFFVSGDMVIRWMQNPCSAAEFAAKINDYRRPAFSENTAPTKIRLSNNSVNEGVLTVGTLTAVNLNASLTHSYEIVEGEDIFKIEGGELKFIAKKEPNSYSVKIRATAGDAGSIENTFKIWVDKIFNTDIEFIGDDFAWEGWGDDDGAKQYVDENGKTVTLKGDDAEAAKTGSIHDVQSQNPLDATLTLGTNKIVKGKTFWPSVEVATAYNFALTGLDTIFINYSSDLPVNLGIGKWTEKMAFGFAVTLPAGENVTKKLTHDMFDMTYSEYANDTERAKVPGSLKQALDITGLGISFSGVDEGTTTRIQVTSLRFTGIPNEKTPEKVANSKIVNNKMQRAISFNGITVGKLNLSVAKAGVYSVDIFSVNGKRLFAAKTTLSAGRNQIAMPKNLAKGVAIIRIGGLNAKLEQKMLIK